MGCGSSKEMKQVNKNEKDESMEKVSEDYWPEYRCSCEKQTETECSIEEKKKALKDMLFDANTKNNSVYVSDNIDVIFIIGDERAERTALANLVYNDTEVQQYFELRKWVEVSEIRVINDISKQILQVEEDGKEIIQNEDDGKEQILGDISKLRMAVVGDKLRKQVRNKRYLIVLDDVWIERSHEIGGFWDDLTGLLIEGKQGSKIIVTTKHHRLAHETSATILCL